MDEKKDKNLDQESGQITVFLSLILVLMLSLVFTVIETVRIQTSKNVISNIVDMGLNSLLAEYDKKLLHYYDLFFVDGAYGRESFSKSNIEERLLEYMSYNYEPDKNLICLGNTDLWKISPDQVSALSVVRASDYEGQIIRNQAVDYIKEKVGLDRLVEIRTLFDRGTTDASKGKSFEDKWKSNKEDFRREKENIEDVEIKDSIQLGLLDSISRMKSKSILTLVLEDNYLLSNKEIDLTNIPSTRSFPQEEMGLRVGEDISETLTEIMYGEYILEKFSSYLDSKDGNNTDEIGKDSILDYQIEYILAGEEIDYKNLEEVVNKILFIREGINFTYLLTDSQKRQEVYRMALALVGYTGSPPLVTVVEMSLLLSWAFGESVMEVRTLLSGGKIDFLKNKENWRLQLSNLGNLKEYKQENSDYKNEKGLSYEDYLRMFLFASNQNEKNRRVMDLIELTLKQIEGYEKFRIEYLISYIELSSLWKVDGLFLSFPFLKINGYKDRDYYYEISMMQGY